MGTDKLDIGRLKEVVAENPRYRAIFETYLERQRGRQDSTPSRMRRVLRETNKGDYPLDELAQFFEDMQETGAGRWIAGRNGKEGRFAWGFHLVSVAEAVLDRKAPVTAVPMEKAEEPGIRPAPVPRKRLPKVVVSEVEHVPSAKPHKPGKHVAKPAPVSVKTVPAAAKMVPAPAAIAAPAQSGLPPVKVQWGPASHEFVEIPFGISKEARAELMELIDDLRSRLR
jgi:hypothetical protein